jgi:N-acetylmuramic acid 6-phosphate (MurNAc-6-P) etherase
LSDAKNNPFALYTALSIPVTVETVVKAGSVQEEAHTVQKEVGNMLTTLIEVEEGLLSSVAAKAELRELLDELYDDLK